MLYKISVFKMYRNMKKWIYSKELEAVSPVQALEKACVRSLMGRMIEIKPIKPFERPQVTRIGRDGLF